MLAIRRAHGYPDTVGAVIRGGPGAGGGYRIIVGCGQDTDKLAAGAGRPGGVLPDAGLLKTWPEQPVREGLMVRTVVPVTQLGTCDVFKARRVIGRPGL